MPVVALSHIRMQEQVQQQQRQQQHALQEAEGGAAVAVFLCRTQQAPAGMRLRWCWWVGVVGCVMCSFWLQQ